MYAVVSTHTQAPAAMSVPTGASSASQPLQPPSDIPVHEPPSDIINSLVASLSTVSTPTDTDQYSPLIPGRATSRTSSRPSRPSSAQRSYAPTSVFSREAPSSFQEIASNHEESPIGAVSVDIAQPPTVKTSRPPSGLSKLTSPPKLSRRPKQSYNLRGAFAPPPDSASEASVSSSRKRPEPILPRLLEEPPASSKGVRSRKSTDEARRAAALSVKNKRDSVQVTRSREAKGKQRADPSSPLYSPLIPPAPSQTRSGSRSPIPERPYYSEYVSPRRSPASSIQVNEDIHIKPKGSSKSLRHEPSSDNFVIVHRKSGETGRTRNDRRRFIPSRSSSVGRTGASPRPPRGSRRSSLRSQHQSPETVHEDHAEDEETANNQSTSRQPSVPSSQKHDSQDLGLGEENNVIKRIKELRAAKERREHLAPPLSPNGRIRIDLDESEMAAAEAERFKPPDTSSASRQLEEAAAIKQHEVVVKAGSATMSPALSSGKTFSSESPVLMSGEYANFSRPRPALIETGSSTNVKQSVQANGSAIKQSPLLSRTSSRAKRWSDQNLRRTSVSHHVRSNSTNTDKASLARPPVSEEQRVSVDSVNGSVEEFLTQPRLSHRIMSPKDGRVISFSEVGDLNGHAVFCCIGMGLTRFVMAFYEELATSLKLRLITPERPGIGDSDAYEEPRVPLHWPDDVRAICNHLSIQSFSLIAHSAGAIYALATALKMASRVRGRIHILSPWIPPSQLNTPPAVSAIAGSPARAGALPRSQRLLRYVPTPLLKLGSGSYLAGAAKPAGAKSPSLKKSGKSNGDSPATSVLSPRPSMGSKNISAATSNGTSTAASLFTTTLSSSRTSADRRAIALAASKRPFTPHLEDEVAVPSDHSISDAVMSAGQEDTIPPAELPTQKQVINPEGAAEWRKRYDARLTAVTWELSTRKGNPAVDLLVCLERSNEVGFMYRDIAREMVIHHGSKDSRVPLENVKWLTSQVLQKCELRVIEGEGHNLMANAGVMAGVLGEVGKEAELGEDYGNLGDASSYKSPLLEDSETF